MSIIIIMKIVGNDKNNSKEDRVGFKYSINIRIKHSFSVWFWLNCDLQNLWENVIKLDLISGPGDDLSDK